MPTREELLSLPVVAQPASNPFNCLCDSKDSCLNVVRREWGVMIRENNGLICCPGGNASGPNKTGLIHIVYIHHLSWVPCVLDACMQNLCPFSLNAKCGDVASAKDRSVGLELFLGLKLT